MAKNNLENTGGELLPGLEIINTDPNKPVYEVLPELALYLASNLQKCGEICNQNVIQIMCESIEVAEDNYICNRVELLIGPQAGGLLNPYRVLAHTILNNGALRAQILDPSFRVLQVYIDEIGNAGVRVGNEPSSTTAAAPTSSPSPMLSP